MTDTTDETPAQQPWTCFEDLLQPAMDLVDATATLHLDDGGVATGFADLDAVTGGFAPGQLVGVCGREGVGTTTLATSLTEVVAIRQNQPVLVFSMEISRTELTQRTLAAESRVRLSDMRTGRMSDDDWTRLARRTSKISQCPLDVDDTPQLDITTLTERAVQWHAATTKPTMIVVDGLHALEPAWPTDDPAQAVAENTRRLKVLARQLQVPIVVTAALNRTPAQDFQPPRMRDTPMGVGRFCDIVLLIHRPDAYDWYDPRMGEADLVLAKHRAGPTSTVTVGHQLHYSRFVDMAPE